MRTFQTGVWASGVCLLAALFAGGGTAVGAPADSPPAADAEAIEYRLRAGDRLTDVAKTFRVTVQDLMEANDVRDPNSLREGQRIRVPNAWVRETAELRRQRDDLEASVQALDGQLADQQKSLVALQADLDRTKGERDSLAWEMTTTRAWQRGAGVIGVLFVVLLAWTLKVLAERARLLRRLRLGAQENAALAAAKEKYRQVSGQFDLRYHMLVRGRVEDPKPYLAEGTAILRRVFAEGEAGIERLLGEMRAEREKAERALDADRSLLDGLLHRLRALLPNDRFRPHAP